MSHSEATSREPSHRESGNRETSSNETRQPAVGGNRTVTVLNIFTPKPGWLDAFVEVQRTSLPRLARNIQGFRGSRLFRAIDGTNAAMISVFDSPEDLKRWMASEPFAAHRAKLATMIDGTAPGVYEVVYEAGSIESPVVE
jgi:heme-degrading monooxygenase HmoA